MSKQEEIAYLVGEIDRAKQELAELQSDPASPAWKITRLTRSISDYEAELQQLRQATAGGTIHNQQIGGNARVGVAVSGNVHGPINHQSGGVRYEGGSTHTGDNVAGDKFTGDKVMGDKVSGDKVLGDQYKENSMSNDTFNMSGDFRGSILNIKSTLSNVSQSVGAASHLEDTRKTELQDLIAQLTAELQKVPAEQSSEAEAVAETAKATVDQAIKEQPNKTLLNISTEGLKQAASNLAAVLPAVLPIATKIAEAVMKFG